jgi:CHAT domain-containing protein
LTVGDLRDHRLQGNSPFLGYLSACSTSANEADRLIDQGIHLVSACQLVGFRHVVGTLWEVNDKHCVDVAKNLYETLRDEG